VILNDPRGRPAARAGGRATLDELLRRAAQRRPGDIALIDPPNRESFTDGTPRRLSYAEADRMVSAIAGRLRRMGLHTDAIVGIQIANTVECLLTLLGVLRAGLIAMPLPLLWRRAECVAALGRVGANALIVSGRVGTVDHYELAMQIAAEIFPVRHVCGYGRDAPDGVVPFDDLYTSDSLDPIPALEPDRADDAGAHLAVITWDVSADGLVPVGRSHAELIAGGLAVLLESALAQDAVLLSTLTLSSFAALATTTLPWLLLGGTLALHQPFDPDTFLAQRRTLNCGTAIVPGPLAAQLAESGHLAGGAGLTSVIGVWRAPEGAARALPWREPRTRLIDVHVFGETGVITACRGADGRPGAIPFGVVFAPRGPKGAVVVAEIAPTANSTVALRGPMVPRAAFPPGAERSGLPHFKIGNSGFVDTGYPCRIDSPMIVTGPPPGIISFGGYRFVERELHDLVARPENGAGSLAVLPDALAGHGLAGTAADRTLVQQSLAKLGANPLLVDAFRDRGRRMGELRPSAFPSSGSARRQPTSVVGHLLSVR
jgi:acyl-CoA synthetase (AMP-forming)/AMP-acid ligase II